MEHRTFSRTWHGNLQAGAYVPANREPQKMQLELTSKMPYGKHKGCTIGQLCRLEPDYVHFLISSAQLAPTVAICNEIQKGYNHEAARLTQELGSKQAGRYLFVLNPIIPKQAPKP